MKKNSSKGLVEKLKAIVKSPNVKKELKELYKSTKNLRNTFNIDD